MQSLIFERKSLNNEKRFSEFASKQIDSSKVSGLNKIGRELTVGFDPTYCYQIAGCKQLVIKIAAGCYATKSAKIQFSPNRMRPADS